MKYVKKPVEIEAELIKDLVKAASCSWQDLPGGVVEAYDKGELIFLPGGIKVRTLEGLTDGNLTSYLIKGIKGELYPCKGDIFLESYTACE